MFRRFLHNHPILKLRRQQLRNHATAPEKLLWEKIRQNQLGVKFRRQYSFGNYILDFYCPQKQLGIEVNGSIHNHQQDLDQYRTRTLNQYGITIIRFSNKEIQDNIDEVISTLRKLLQ